MDACFWVYENIRSADGTLIEVAALARISTMEEANEFLKELEVRMDPPRDYNDSLKYGLIGASTYEPFELAYKRHFEYRSHLSSLQFTFDKEWDRFISKRHPS